MLKYWWRSRREVWCLAVVARTRFGRCHSPYVRTWSFGPVTLAHTNLDRI